MTSGEASNGGASLHPEWDLMYRKGLTVARIADLCSVLRQTVGGHIRAQRALYPDIEMEHLANRPVARRPTVQWLETLDAVSRFCSERGRFPTSTDPDAGVCRLARWLQDQRSRLRRGVLRPEQRRRLDGALPGWADNQQARLGAARRQERIAQLQAFRDREGRWPHYEGPVDEAERVLGVWLHGQRQAFGAGRLTAEQLEQLDAAALGWNAWRVKHAARNLLEN